MTTNATNSTRTEVEESKPLDQARIDLESGRVLDREPKYCLVMILKNTYDAKSVTWIRAYRRPFTNIELLTRGEAQV